MDCIFHYKLSPEYSKSKRTHCSNYRPPVNVTFFFLDDIRPCTISVVGDSLNGDYRIERKKRESQNRPNILAYNTIRFKIRSQGIYEFHRLIYKVSQFWGFKVLSTAQGHPRTMYKIIVNLNVLHRLHTATQKEIYQRLENCKGCDGSFVLCLWVTYLVDLDFHLRLFLQTLFQLCIMDE